jgi:LysR family transcriptional regulator, glycine cleavage system transcriptional activator
LYGSRTKNTGVLLPSDRDRILTISTVPCFAAYWLLPRLADFNEHHPNIQVNIRAALSLTT